MVSSIHKEWSRSIICRPKDNLTTEAGLRAQQSTMAPSTESGSIPTSMGMLLGGEYARIWLQDRDRFQKKFFQSKPKIIPNDFEWWIKLRKTNKCFCTK
ncbi:uncharacterized protein LOC135426319 [Drosophila montana]|uniref:uncharacterized protein LOC135426319 n=1 Tax=Drosophila montana TaxID=40370 RepID=UPI00313BD131